MWKYIIIVCVSSGLLLIACQRDEGVRAGTVQAGLPDTPGDQEIRGELIPVNVAKKIFSVRIENGMEQTFQFNDQTKVMGLTFENGSRVRDLVGKEGSEVTIQWEDAGLSGKMATRVAVTEIVTNRPRRRVRRD